MTLHQTLIACEKIENLSFLFCEILLYVCKDPKSQISISNRSIIIFVCKQINKRKKNALKRTKKIVFYCYREIGNVM